MGGDLIRTKPTYHTLLLIDIDSLMFFERLGWMHYCLYFIEYNEEMTRKFVAIFSNNDLDNCEGNEGKCL